MCRNIKTLFNFDPPATDDEIRAVLDGLLVLQVELGRVGTGVDDLDFGELPGTEIRGGLGKDVHRVRALEGFAPGAQIDLECPGSAVLVNGVQVGFGDRLRVQPLVALPVAIARGDASPRPRPPRPSAPGADSTTG